MSEADGLWTGDEWEKFCLALMHIKHGADEVQRVPAAHKGDFGIEAFTFSGIAVQCYVAQEPLSTHDRYVKQRDKLTTDLGKLEKNLTSLQALLGATTIRRYLFMVPAFNSAQIVTHATSKTTELVAKSLPIIHNNFRIKVCTADDFPEQQAALLARPKELIAAASPATETVHTWIETNVELSDVASQKLDKVFTPARRQSYLENLIAQNIKGNGVLNRLRPRYPDQWEAATRAVNEKERVLALEYAMAGTACHGEVAKLARDLTGELQAAVPDVGIDTARTLAWGAIADWLMRCPLDFFVEDGAL